MRQRKGFTLIELLVVISIIALLIGILLPALGAARQTARQLQSNTNVRGIHQSMVVFAQNNKTGNSEGYFPGLSTTGGFMTTETGDDNNIVDKYAGIDSATDLPVAVDQNQAGNEPGVRFLIMVEENAVSPEMLINPLETGPVSQAERIDNSGGSNDGNLDYSGNFYSYAALELVANSNRLSEWSETINSSALVMSDRLLPGGVGAAGADNKQSHVTSADDREWQGSIGWNDNRVETGRTSKFDTRYGFERSGDDNMFISGAASGNGISFMIHNLGGHGTNTYDVDDGS